MEGKIDNEKVVRQCNIYITCVSVVLEISSKNVITQLTVDFDFLRVLKTSISPFEIALGSYFHLVFCIYIMMILEGVYFAIIKIVID